MRSIIVGVAAGVLLAGTLLAAALIVLPDLVPEADPTPLPTPRDISSGSPGITPFPPSPASADPGSSASPGAGETPVPGASGSSAPSGEPGIGLGVGQRAPALAVDLLGGGTLDLAAYRGSPVWLNFMATWCPTCVEEIPQMVKYRALLGDRGLETVLVDVREDAKTVAAFVKALDFDLPVGLDPAGRAQRAWGAFALPIHYFIDADGIVRSVLYGEPSPPMFEEALTRIIPGLSFEPSPTPVPSPGPSEPAGSGEPAASGEPSPSAP
jgi:thiol-disulfide isomerase/thioredoxin